MSVNLPVYKVKVLQRIVHSLTRLR